MKRCLILFFILLFAVIIIASDKEDTPQQFIFSETVPSVFDSNRLERLDSALQSLVECGLIPHAVTFVAQNANVVHNKSYGWRDIKRKIPCETTDIFRLASQTKAITAVAALTLFEEGKILLDDPVKKFIPEFANPQVLTDFNTKDTTYTTRPAKRDITIRDLLTHSSGYSYGNDKTRRIYDKADIPLFPMLSNEDVTLGEAVRKLAKCPLEHDPGERFTYGMSVDILGAVIEVVSGMPVDQFFKMRIFEPLGMNDTYFYVPDSKKSRVVTLTTKAKPDAPIITNTRANGMYQTLPYAGSKKFFSTGAGLCGSIEDYAKFCQMILNKGEFNGARILGRKTVELMCKNAVGNQRGEIGFGLAFDDFRSEYSYRSILSEGSLRWGGWYGTDYVIDPKEKIILLIYINQEPNNLGFDLKVLFHNLVYQALN